MSESVLINSSAIPDNYKDQQHTKIRNPFGGDLSVKDKGTGSQAGFGYHITLDNLPKSACVSLATLNLGTSAAGYGVNIDNPENYSQQFGTTASSGSAKNSAITPGEAANSCTKNNNTNKVTYFMK